MRCVNSAPMFTYLRSKFSGIYIAILLAAFLGSAHLLIRTSNYGPELTQDSWNFVSTAENLASGDGFEKYLRRVYVYGGPIHPLLVASFGVLGFDPINIGRFINIIGLGLIILLTGYQLSRYVRHSFLAIIGSVAVMTSYSMAEISSYLMTDTLYILFSLLALVQLLTFLGSETTVSRPLVVSAVFTSLAMATRYIGVAVILTGIILIITRQNFPLYHRLKCVTLYGSISITLTGIWVIRNWLSVGTFTGYENNSFGYYESSIVEYIEHYSNIFMSHVLVIRLGFDWFICLSFTLICLFIWRKNLGLIPSPTNFWTPNPPSYATIFMLFGLYSLIYIVILIAMSSRLDYASELPARYLTPIYVPVIIMASALLDLLLRSHSKYVLGLNLIVVLILTGILSSGSLATRWNIDETVRALRLNAEPLLFEKYGYSKNMDTLIYLRGNPFDGPIYSNGIHLLYWLTDVPLGGIIAEDRGDASCLMWVRSLARSPEPSYIAYFTIGKERIDFIEGQFNSCNIQELESDPNIQSYLERLVEGADGIVYRVTASPQAATGL